MLYPGGEVKLGVLLRPLQLQCRTPSKTDYALHHITDPFAA
jgi:hypothetical protein